MCVSCDVKSDMSNLPQLVAPSDSTQLVMNFQLSWLSSLEVRNMTEPYGSLLKSFYRPNENDVRSALEPGVYAAQVRIGNNSAGITHCALVIPQTRLVVPFVQYVMTSAAHTY